MLGVSFTGNVAQHVAQGGIAPIADVLLGDQVDGGRSIRSSLRCSRRRGDLRIDQSRDRSENGLAQQLLELEHRVVLRFGIQRL
jgi:hypothetical protein